MTENIKKPTRGKKSSSPLSDACKEELVNFFRIGFHSLRETRRQQRALRGMAERICAAIPGIEIEHLLHVLETQYDAQKGMFISLEDIEEMMKAIAFKPMQKKRRNSSVLGPLKGGVTQ